ncbi:MAG: ATP-binding protein, partial [Anaerovorax sp.]
MIDKREHIVIGLSGGPDSVCLFHVLYALKEEFQLSLHVVHVNHQFRPGAAEEDQHYVEMLCKEYSVPCHSFIYDVNRIAKEQGITSEEAGRKVRYQSFYEVAKAIYSKN